MGEIKNGHWNTLVAVQCLNIRQFAKLASKLERKTLKCPALKIQFYTKYLQKKFFNMRVIMKSDQKDGFKMFYAFQHKYVNPINHEL